MTDPNGAAILMVTWIPSIYPSHVSINIPAPWIRHGLCSYLPMVSPWFSPGKTQPATAKFPGGTPQEESDLHGRSAAVATMGQTRRLLVNRSMDWHFIVI